MDTIVCQREHEKQEDGILYDFVHTLSCAGISLEHADNGMRKFVMTYCPTARTIFLQNGSMTATCTTYFNSPQFIYFSSVLARCISFKKYEELFSLVTFALDPIYEGSVPYMKEENRVGVNVTTIFISELLYPACCAFQLKDAMSSACPAN